MSEPPAEPAPAPKRVRFSETTTTTLTSTKTAIGRATQPPKQLAVAFVKQHCATLQSKISDILITLGNTNIVHMMNKSSLSH